MLDGNYKTSTKSLQRVVEGNELEMPTSEPTPVGFLLRKKDPAGKSFAYLGYFELRSDFSCVRSH